MANYRVATASDYQNLLKEYNKNAQGVSEWEQMFLQPLQETTQAQAKQVSQQASYDISSAYANYKKNQLNLLQSQQLGTGFKEQVGSELKSEYESAYSTAKTEEASSLANLSESYLQTLAEEDEQLYEQGSKFAELEQAMYDYAGITDLESMYSTEGLGYYETTEDGTTKLTEKGKDFFDELMHSSERVGENSLEAYLAENNEDLYDFYKQNKSVVNELIGGLSKTDISYSPEERKYGMEADKLETDFTKALSQIESETVKDYYSNLKTEFASDEERKAYYEDLYNKITKTPEYLGSAKDVSNGLFSTTKYEYNGKTYESKGLINYGSALSYEITNNLKLKKKLDSGELKVGDVIEYNGNILVIEDRQKGPGRDLAFTRLNTYKEAEDVMKSRGYKKHYDSYTHKTT